MTRTTCYANMTSDDIRMLDLIAKRLGYSSRTKFITAIIHSIIHDKNLTENTRLSEKIVEATLEIENLRRGFIDILDEYAFPVIAMHGADYAFRVLQPDLQAWMYERHHAVPQVSDMREWIKSYAETKKGEILHYRIARTTERYAEEHEMEENEVEE